MHMICAVQDCIAYDSSYEMKVQYDRMWDDESKIEDELHILTVGDKLVFDVSEPPHFLSVRGVPSKISQRY